MKNNSLKLVLVSIIIVAISLSGCETLRKKFTRTPKERKKPPISVPEEGQSQAYPNSILYQNHYILWKSWEDELIISLGENHKKEVKCAQEALSELGSIKELLNEEGQKNIEPLITELQTLAEKIEKETLSFSSHKQLKNDLIEHKTRVEKNFHYHKITNLLKPD